MPMKNPPHPGKIVLTGVHRAAGTDHLSGGRSTWSNRTTLSELVNERRGISPEMAIRLSQVFGGSAQSWITQQALYDLAQIPSNRIKLKRLKVA